MSLAGYLPPERRDEMQAYLENGRIAQDYHILITYEPSQKNDAEFRLLCPPAPMHVHYPSGYTPEVREQKPSYADFPRKETLEALRALDQQEHGDNSAKNKQNEENQQ